MQNPNILIMSEESRAVKEHLEILSANGYRANCATEMKKAQMQIEGGQISLTAIKLDRLSMWGLDLLLSNELPKHLPIIVIDNTPQEQDFSSIVLRGGATCCIPHMPSPEHLLAQIHSILTFQSQIESAVEAKCNEADKNQILSYQALRVNQRSQQVYLGNQRVNMQPLQFRLLAFLMRNACQQFTRDALKMAVFGGEYVVDNAVTKCICGIRKQLPELRNVIVCRNGGYVFDERVTYVG